MRDELLTRNECEAMRGIAIIGIFLHNYCHWLNPVVKENEYQFFNANVSNFLRAIVHPDALLPLHVLSFFGHYGVPIFLFLSAYGLVMKYENGPVLPPIIASKPWRGLGTFMLFHYKKLFRMMIVGFVAFTMLDLITPHSHHYQALDVVAMLGMFNNLLPHPDDIIWPGPYWFFGLMLQCYFVFRLLVCRRSWKVVVGLMVVCVAVQLLLPPESEAMNRYRYNFMGSMLPFGLGVLFARFGERVILITKGGMTNLMWLVVTLFLIASASKNFVTWTIVPAFVCMAAIYFVRAIETIPSQKVSALVFGAFEWVGSISAALFVVHPILRKIFIPISRQGDVYTGLLLYVISSLSVAWLFQQIMKKIPSPKMNE